MKFEHQTKHLLIKILHPDQAPMVLSFYQKNKSFLEPYEPSRCTSFYTLEFQRANLSYEYSSFLKRSYLRVWLFERKAPTIPIGTICFSNFLHGAFCNCMLGYKLDQDCLRNGFMTEALTYLLPLVCKEYDFHRIEAYVMPSNIPSIQLLEKLSFQQEGLLHDYAKICESWEDHYLYTYLA